MHGHGTDRIMLRLEKVAMTTYYVSVFSDGLSTGEVFWRVDKERAQQINVSKSDLAIHTPDPGEDTMTTLRKRFPGQVFSELSLLPGE